MNTAPTNSLSKSSVKPPCQLGTTKCLQTLTAVNIAPQAQGTRELHETCKCAPKQTTSHTSSSHKKNSYRCTSELTRDTLMHANGRQFLNSGILCSAISSHRNLRIPSVVWTRYLPYNGFALLGFALEHIDHSMLYKFSCYNSCAIFHTAFVPSCHGIF